MPKSNAVRKPEPITQVGGRFRNAPPRKPPTVMQGQAGEPVPSTVLEDITPEIAARYLETAQRHHDYWNRPVRDWKVKELRRQMEEGRWRVTNQGIGFDKEGILIDGQHRLFAVLEMRAGSVVQMNVTRNLDRDARDVIDTGIRRTASDTLSFHGERNVVNLQTALRWQFKYERKELQNIKGRSLVPTNEELLAVLERHPDIRRSVSAVQGLRKLKTISTGMLGWFHYQFSSLHPDEAALFFERLKTGANLESTDPIYRLREALLATIGKSNLNPFYKAAIVIKAWNAFVQSRRLHALGWRDDEEFPEIAR